VSSSAAPAPVSSVTSEAPTTPDLLLPVNPPPTASPPVNFLNTANNLFYI